MTLLGLDFPPITHVTRWPDIFFGGTPFAINKTVLIYFASVLITLAFFFYAARKHQLIPRGVQNMAESSIDFGMTLPGNGSRMNRPGCAGLARVVLGS